MFTEYDYQNQPIVDIVNEMLLDAARKRASDIHMDPTPDVLNVRIRVDGELILYAVVPEAVKKNLVTRVKIISGMNITESRIPQDGAIKMTADGKDLDFRVSTLPIVYGEKVVIRLLDYSATTSSLDSLGFSERNYELVQKAISKPNGIILVTGATGSGKSTTVYAILETLNTESRNIITVEDPVEMKIAGINQVQTMSEIGLTFATALRSILRQDPDIIMIGEIRDNETARIAVRASITGHLVLSTIHTNNSLTTIERLVDMEVERYLLGSALEAIISQRLCKKLCPKCREARPTTDYEKRVFKAALGMDIENIYKPVGCNNCYKGYTGRIPLHEVLVLNQEIRDAIVNNMPKEQIRELIYNTGTATSLLNDGLIKVINGLTSFEEVLRVIDIEDDLGEKQSDLKNAIIGKVDRNQKKMEEAKFETINQEPKQNMPPSMETLNY
ncbi:MAG: type II/IV secretion system protein [Bacilli bacterium]|nr:type II/IV secretion system protein [Bacilli bacterium]